MKFFKNQRWNRSSELYSKFSKLAEVSTELMGDSVKEINVKIDDRVDITLEEYERLKDENRLLNEEVTRLRKILSDIRIPVNIYDRIKVDTIKTSVCHNVKDFIDTFHIEFDADVPYPYGEDYEY